MKSSLPLGRYPSGVSAADEPTSSAVPQPSRHRGPLWQVWKGWLWLTGPRPERFGTDIAGQERLRRSRLISVLLVVVAVAILLLIPGAVKNPVIWQAVLIDAFFGVASAVLNRLGKVTLSGLLQIALVDVSTIGFIITQAGSNPADPGLSNTGAAVFYILMLAILNAGMILPNRLIPVVGALQVGLTVVVFAKLPHSRLLQEEIAASNAGQSYNAVLGPILLQVCGAAIVWLYSWSVDHAIRRASQAEELAEARARLNEQARQIAEQKRRLEEGINVLQAVQARVANGDYSARITLQDNELLPLGVSFNIMAERLGRNKHIEQDYHRLESALEQLLGVCSALAQGIAPTAMRATNTVADRIYPFLARLHQVVAQLMQGSLLAEDLYTVLHRQHDTLSDVESRLIGSLALAKDLALEAIQVLPRVPEERAWGTGGMAAGKSSGPLGAQEKGDFRTAASLRVKTLIDQQISLLDQAKRSCAQASDLSMRCTQGARILSQRLKEAG